MRTSSPPTCFSKKVCTAIVFTHLSSLLAARTPFLSATFSVLDAAFRDHTIALVASFGGSEGLSLSLIASGFVECGAYLIDIVGLPDPHELGSDHACQSRPQGRGRRNSVPVYAAYTLSPT